AHPKFSAVLFDCDGVLVDSESITNGVLHQMLRELGWQLTAEECVARFVGKMLRDEADVIEEHTGFRIDEEWMNAFRRRRNAELELSLQAIPGVVGAVRRVAELYPCRIACASGADRPKIELQLKKIGLFDVFGDRIFSGMEQPNSKPAPRRLSLRSRIPGRRPRRGGRDRGFADRSDRRCRRTVPCARLLPGLPRAPESRNAAGGRRRRDLRHDGLAHGHARGVRPRAKSSPEGARPGTGCSPTRRRAPRSTRARRATTSPLTCAHP